MGSLGAFLGCLIAATGCASDQEARRSETTTARAHHRDARHDRDRNNNGVRDSREPIVASDDNTLDENVAVKPVPIANGEGVRDNVGERENVRDNIRDTDRNGVADNGRVRDRDGDGRLDDERAEPVTDRQLTSRIRESIVADDQLSTKAKNVEIISKNGAVTLRGPVGTAAEKSRVESHAQNQAGAKRVNNEIEVTR